MVRIEADIDKIRRGKEPRLTSHNTILSGSGDWLALEVGTGPRARPAYRACEVSKKHDHENMSEAGFITEVESAKAEKLRL